MGVGPRPIPIDKLDTPSLVQALRFMMRPEVQAAATETGQGIKHVSQLLQQSQKLLCRQSLALCCSICTVQLNATQWGSGLVEPELLFMSILYTVFCRWQLSQHDAREISF